jgi:hypothetical protein
VEFSLRKIFMVTKEKKDKERKYPMGGLGLKDKEEEALSQILQDKQISLKFLQRYLIRKVLRGEIKVGE